MNDWLKNWDPSYRPVLEDMAAQCKFTQIRQIETVSGASGAQTFIVQPSGDAGVPAVGVLKIGPKDIIDKDAQGLKEAKSYYADANYVVCESETATLKALLMKSAGGDAGITFEQFYLANETQPKDVEHIISQLFETTLRTRFLNVHKDKNPFALYTFESPEAHSRALRAIGDGLPTLVRWWQRATRSRHSEMEWAHTCLCHGDLHRKNIIVSGKSAYVIDFGLTREWHVMRDFAKLERDICLFLYPGESSSTEPIDELQTGESCNATSDQEGNCVNSSFAKAISAVRAVRAASRRLLQDTWAFEYRVALLAQYIFAAGDGRLDRDARGLALSYANKFRLELERMQPELAISGATRASHHRRDVLWRLAYVFFRLDQLPSGGWGKSLPAWLDALLEGDRGEIHRNPETRTKGGTDLTSRAFLNYLRFLRRLGSYGASADDLPSKARIAQAVRTNLAKKIGWSGGIGVGQVGKGAQPVVPVRHTVMGMLTFLYFSDCTGQPALDEIRKTETFLIGNLKHWNLDTSHPFGCFCILAKLREMLTREDCQGWLRYPTKLIDGVDRTLKEMSEALLKPTDAFELKPDNTCGLQWRDFRFRPYAGFWRIDRSNLLMYLPFLMTEDGATFLPFLDQRLLNSCTLELVHVFRDLAQLPEVPGGMFVYYHRDPQLPGVSRPLDWGLTAELLALLRSPAIERAVVTHDSRMDVKKYRERTNALAAALELSFDGYHRWPVFKFTHGVSFGCYLEAVDWDLLNIDSVRELDQRINAIAERGVTEHDLDTLCSDITASALKTSQSDLGLFVSDMRDILVDKLVSGEHVPTEGDRWLRRVEAAREATIKFFDGKGGQEYADYYQSRVIRPFVTQICEMVKTAPLDKRRALDIGCGPGQYAVLLEKEGYSVDLADASSAMLRTAHNRLKRPDPGDAHVKRIERLLEYYKPETFDLVFACAMMVHVPQAIAPEIYRSFHTLLRPGGALFVNVKIGDHTLIGIGERYFEYYRDHSIPVEMLQRAGFTVRHIDMGFNDQTMYRDPKRIHWANFFCTR